MDKLDLLLTKVKREKANAAQGGIDGAYINQFLKDAGSFVEAQKTTLDSADWAKSTDAAANKARGEALFDLTSRADMISKYLEANKGAIQKASYNDLKNALRQYTQAFASVRGISEGNKNFYSQFATQQDYDNYVAEEAEKAKTAEEKRKVLEQIDQTRQDYANWKAQADTVEGSGIYIGGNPLQHERVSTIVQEGGLLRPLYEQVGEKDIYEWNLEKITSTAKKDPQYKEYVKKASDVEGIIKNSEFKDVIEPEELELLKYFIAKDRENGTNLQDDYIYYMEEIWAQRAGEKEAEWYKDKPFLAALYGFKSGWDQIGSNLSNLGNMFSMDPDKGYAPQTQSQVASGLIRENLDGFGKFVFDVGSATTNMVPSILLSTAVGILNPAAGAATGGALMGAGAAGSAYSEKVQAGWSQSEASSYAAMVGASEMALESVLGAVAGAAGKGASGLLSKAGQTGLKKIDDILAKVAKNAAGKIGAEMLSEGFEEGIQSILEPYFAHVASGEEFTVDMGEALYSALLGAVTGGIFAGGKVAIDSVLENKLTKNEKTVIKAEVDAQIKAQQEQLGRELTAKEKSDIQKKVEAQLRKGQISTDRIEAALGGEGYAKYQSAYDREQAALKELEGLYEGEELKKQQQYIRENSALQGLREELSRGVSESVKNDRHLHESYLEKGRRSEAFTADLSKYSAKEAGIVRKAMDSGVLNNTSRSHELVDLIAKIGAKKGIEFDFVNNEKLKKSGFAIKGATVNGYVTDSGITLNVESAKALNSVVGHEITHVLEGSEMYSQLAKIVKEYAEAKGEYKDRYKALVELYQQVEGYKGAEGLEKIKAELVADMIGDYLFTDGAFVKRLLENRNLFQKIWDEIKYLCKLATAGTVEAEKLAKMERTFEKVFRSETKNPTREGEVKYSFKGYAEDGKGIYESNFPKGTPRKAKGERILKYIQDVWSKKPITLRIERDGEVRHIEAKFDPTYSDDKNVKTDASKLMGGNRHGNATEKRVTLDLADDYYQIASESEYNYSKDETGKETDPHQGVKHWHYFINDIYFAEQGSEELTPYRVSINVKEKENGHYFYSFSAEKAEGTSTQRTLHAAVNDSDDATANGSSSKKSISAEQVNVNKKNSVSAEGWQIKGVDVLLQQEADKNGLVWENGVPFRKDLLELAKRQAEEDFPIAPPTPAEREAARVAEEKTAQSSTGQVTEAPVKSQAAENIAPPTPAEREAARMAEEKATKEKKKKTEPVTKSKPIIAKKDLRDTMYTLFSVPEGQRSAVGEVIDRYADRLVKNGSLTETDRQDFFNRMYESGAVEMAAEDYLAEARSYLKGSRIYVPDSVIADFGDDWNAFRRQAFANGIYLSRTRTSGGHSVAGIDTWNQDLAGELPGLFDAEETDQRSILERIIQVAEEGKAEQLSLSEYTSRLANAENIAETEFLDNMERQMDWALRTFAEKANLEIHLRDRTGKQIAKERQRYKESADRARERKQLSELQQKTLKQLQWLSKNRNRAPEELRFTWDAVLGDIDLYAVGAANEMRWSNKYNATWKDLAQMYKDAMKNDPNFLPSKELERIVSRIDGTKIEDMDFDALQELYKAAIGLRTEYYNRNNVIQDEAHRMFAEVYADTKQEIDSAPGGYKGKKLDKLFNMEQLSPMNVLERMAGWNPDSTFYSMAKQLERGERDVRAFNVKAKKMLQDFLVKNEKWVKKADGQGKDAVWYEIEVPELMELGMGDKPIFGETVKVYMTPSQKVHMYLESKNLDNLRHMTGGRTFVNKELYSQGKRAEALAQGTTVRLAPETVKALVSDLTAEEKALAEVLDAYYNKFAKKEINKVSNILYGYDKAMGKNYAPIYTNRNYTKTEFGVFDASAEGVGNLKGRQYAVNPSYNISALDAFERSVDQTARFCGMAIPTRNWTTLMNWRVKNNSTADVITHKWGKEGKDYIDNLVTALQGGGSTETDAVSSWINKLQSNYISAVFGGNPSIVLKQLGSVPMASAYLGISNLPSPKQVANIDRGLISKYTQDLEWRTMGYTTQETKHLKENPNWTQSNKAFRFVFGGDAIVAMDGWAASTLWPWAENKVRKEHPELNVGTQEQIDAGESPFYKKVAEEFEEAVSRSQSVSDEIHQSTMRKSKNPLARAFTLFRSDSAQTYNTIRQKVGEARYYMRTGAKKEVAKSAKRAVGAAVLALSANVVWGAGINLLMALWKNKGKQYRDDEDELSVESVLSKLGMDAFGSVAGVIAGGAELADLIGNLITGDPLYDIDTPGMEQLNDLIETVYKTGKGIKEIVEGAIEVGQNGGDVAKYFEANMPHILGIVKDVAKDAATYIPGLPASNLESYLIGALKLASPELGKQYDDAFGAGRDKLTPKQQEEFAESGMTIQEYWNYREGLSKLSKQAEKLDYINSLDVDEDTKYVLKWYLFDADKAAEEDPERFAWLENEIGYVEYRELDKDAQEKWSWAYNNQEEYEYMKKNGIRLEDVDVFTVTMTDFNSQKSAVAASLGGAAKYKEYMDEIGDVKGDKNASGDTISGSVKKNVWAYIDELDLEDGQKYILFKLKYPKDTKYDHKIVGYLRSRKDITAQKRVDIYNELGIEP